MNNKRKNRPGPPRYSNDRPQRGRSVQAEGIYNNSFFMHAATSFVGSLVQVQTHSGSIYEGVFHTFSPNFDVALDLAQCIKDSQNQNSEETKKLHNCIIFRPNHIVSIVSKEIDFDFVTEGAFQTDSAISSKCNGSSRSEEKQLEPWDPSGGTPNGDVNLELDGNANGWDVNEMFNKNEKLYGVQTTFDDSLAGYTVQIEKKNTEDYKAAEEKAEKIAQEIESHPKYQERLDLENGDEESRFAAVERPLEQNSDNTSSILSSSNQQQQQQQQSQQQQQQQQQNSISSNLSGGGGSNKSMMQSSKGPNTVVDKYIPPPKRKNMQPGGKLVRNTQPPNNNNGPLSQHNSHSSSKNNNYQSMQMQNSQQYLSQNYSHMHGHMSNMSQSKMNGDGNSNSSSNKPLPQRGIRQYSQQSATSASGGYVDQQQSSIGGQMTLGKPPVHVSHNHSHVNVGQHLSNNIQETTPPAPQNQGGHIVPGHHVVMSAGSQVVPTPTQTQPPPQPQRQQRVREEQLETLRKFQQEFHLVSSNAPPPQQQHQPPQQVQMNQVKTPSVSPHQPPQPSLSPPHHQHPQQQLSPMLQHSQQQSSQQSHQQHQHQSQHHQQHHQQSQQQMASQQQTQTQSTQHSQQQQTDNSPPIQKQKSSQHSQPHIVQQQQQEQQSYQSVAQQQSPPTIILAGTSMAPPSSSPPQQIVNTNSNANGNESNPSGDKVQTPGPVVKKTHVLNPAAKPFTPRSPSTPNPSRPHTPQTPGPAMTPGVFTPGPHVAAGQAPIMYVTQPPQPTFQATPHPHAGQQGRLRRAPVAASQMQVSAATATGAPLLTAAPIQPFIHYPQSHPPHFQSQPYQHMIPQVRMFPEPPPQQIQFLAQTPPSTTPSPGQPHQQFHPGPQPSPAGGGPPAFGPTAQPPPHFQMMCPVITGHPQLVPNYYQGAAQTPHHAQQFQVIMQQQHPAQ